MTQTKMVSEKHVRRRKPVFKVGDRVQFIYMSRPVIGQIVEDRGSIGIRGRRLYRVVGKAGGVTRVLELPAEELQHVVVS